MFPGGLRLTTLLNQCLHHRYALTTLPHRRTRDRSQHKGNTLTQLPALEHLLTHPDAPAIMETGGTSSWRELFSDALAVAELLSDCGVAPDEHVAALLGNRREYYAILLGSVNYQTSLGFILSFILASMGLVSAGNGDIEQSVRIRILDFGQALAKRLLLIRQIVANRRRKGRRDEDVLP